MEKQICVFSQSCFLLPFLPRSLSEQDPISLYCSRRLVNSKHNQTLWSALLWSWIESISCGVLQWQSPITFCVQAFTALELFHFIIALKLPPSKANRQQRQWQQHSRPCHPCTAGGSFQEFLVFVWGKKIHVYTNHRCKWFKKKNSVMGQG